MDVVRVICYYHGKWITSDQTGKILAYEGGDEKGIRLPKLTSLDELQDLASELLGVDRDSHTIYMRYSAKDSVSGVVKFIKIRDFIDLDYFLNQDSQTMVPLYIEAHAKEDNEAKNPRPPRPSIMSSHSSNVLQEARPSPVSNPASIFANIEVKAVAPVVFSEPFPIGNLDSTEIMYGDIDYTDNDDSGVAPLGGAQSRSASHEQVANEGPTVPNVAISAPHGRTILEVGQSYVGLDEESPDSVVRKRQAMSLVHKRRKAESSPASFQPRNIWPTTKATIHCAAMRMVDGMVNDCDEVGVEGIFDTKDALRHVLALKAIKDNREYRVLRSSNTVFTQCCLHEGCPYWIRAMRQQPSGLWKITKFVDKHTCGLKLSHKEHRQATSSVIGQIIKHKYVGAGRSYRPREIQEDFQTIHGVLVSYGTCWRAREAALEIVRGSPEESYALLPSYCHELEQKNPGTVTSILTDADHNFLYFFMALGASIKGFVEQMRPVLSVDATFLKCKYRGTLLIAAALDGNNHIYPVALGICDNENDASWEWFFVKLRSVIGNVPNLVVVSDRHDSIRKACYKAFPEAAYTNCIVHLKANMKKKFSLPEDDADLNLFISAAKKPRQKSCLQLLRKMSDPVRQWITGEEVGYALWARSYCKYSRFDSMSTNIAESLNARLKEARELPVTSLVEYIRHVLQLWFFTRRSNAASCTTFLTPDRGERILHDRMQECLRLIVHPINRTEFNVVDPCKSSTCVNLESRSCSCRAFDLEGLPCKHALAAARYRQWNPYELCARYYTKETWQAAYAMSIYPVGPQENWNVPENVKNRVVLPPIMRPESGRPRKQRTLSAGETKRRNKCSRCGREGHNRATCKKPIPLSHRPNATTLS